MASEFCLHCTLGIFTVIFLSALGTLSGPCTGMPLGAQQEYLPVRYHSIGIFLLCRPVIGVAGTPAAIPRRVSYGYGLPLFCYQRLHVLVSSW